MRTMIKIFHNLATDDEGRHLAWVFGYTPGDPLAEVFRYTVGGTVARRDDEAVCAHAFDVFNVGDDPAFCVDGLPEPLAVMYRSKGLRSLSVGDVVSIAGILGDDERCYAVASRGFTEIVPRSAPQFGEVVAVSEIENKES